MTRRIPRALPLMAAFSFAACSDNPTFPDVSDDLHAELEFGVTELVTLTEVEVEVRLHSDAAGTVTDVAMVAVEMRREGDADWRATELTLHDDHFSGLKTFFSSGEYEARVVAQLHGSAETVVLYQTTEHLHVDRIHREVGAFRVEFETYPGHLHEGDTAEIAFWILEAGGDGHGHAVGGMSPDIVCMDPSGATEEHMAHEHEPGEYGTQHTLLEAGTAQFELHFTDGAGADLHAEFVVPVSHAH